MVRFWIPKKKLQHAQFYNHLIEKHVAHPFGNYNINLLIYFNILQTS